MPSEIFALDVLHERHFHNTLVTDGADVGGNRFESGYLRGTPSAFSGYYLEAVVGNLPERDGLDDTNLTNAGGQFLQGRFVELPAWLVGIGLYLFNGNLIDRAAALRAHRFGRDQRVKSPSEGVAFL